MRTENENRYFSVWILTYPRHFPAATHAGRSQDLDVGGTWDGAWGPGHTGKKSEEGVMLLPKNVFFFGVKIKIFGAFCH